MIKEISISNYKSIDSLSIDLGRINVLIGENGAGKSNILEAIALAGAASADKLDNEFLTSRGIRVTQPEYMRPAFPECLSSASILINAKNSDDEKSSWKLNNSNEPYSKWICETESIVNIPSRQKIFRKIKDEKNYKKLIELLKFTENYVNSKGLSNVKELQKDDAKIIFSKFIQEVQEDSIINALSGFVIFSPENSALRILSKEGQIEPLGINGEGLLRLLTVISSNESMSNEYEEIKSSLKVLGWFNSLDVILEKPIGRIEIQDKYIDKEKKYFDQLSANEGFLFLLFYFALFSSNLTPNFFAIDNIDVSLNPKLCQELIKRLSSMAVKHGKQVILTTHNPAILDGLNLDDDDQRLFVISRNSDGHTQCERIHKPESKIPNRAPKKLSELFMSGALGGIPKSF